MRRRKQQCLLDLVNTDFRNLGDGGSQLIDADGASVKSWDASEMTPQLEGQGFHTPVTAVELTVFRKFHNAQALIKECQQGAMTMEVQANGDIKFYKDGRPKVLITLPDIGIHVLE